MKRTRETSGLYRSWPRKVAKDMTLLKRAIRRRNFPMLGNTAESNALAMHATMFDSKPPVIYWLPESVLAMRKIWRLRQTGLHVYFTMDAGPNLKVLFLKKDTAAVKKAFPKVPVEALYPNAGDPIHALAQAVKDALDHETPPAQRGRRNAGTSRETLKSSPAET